MERVGWRSGLGVGVGVWLEPERLLSCGNTNTHQIRLGCGTAMETDGVGLGRTRDGTGVESLSLRGGVGV